MENKLIEAIEKLFIDKHEYFELGSSQSDLVEAYVKSTIIKVIEENKWKY